MDPLSIQLSIVLRRVALQPSLHLPLSSFQEFWKGFLWCLVLFLNSNFLEFGVGLLHLYPLRQERISLQLIYLSRQLWIREDVLSVVLSLSHPLWDEGRLCFSRQFRVRGTSLSPFSLTQSLGTGGVMMVTLRWCIM